MEFSKELLKKLDIDSTIHIAKKKGTESNIRGKIYYYKDDFYRLSTHRKESIKNFAVKVSFSIKRKYERLLKVLEILEK